MHLRSCALVLGFTIGLTACGGASHQPPASAVSELRSAAAAEERARPSHCSRGQVFVEADKLLACIAPPQLARFRHFASVCASARSKMTAIAKRYFDSPEEPAGQSVAELVAHSRLQLEHAGRESEGVLSRAIIRLRADGAGGSEISDAATHQAELAAFVREVHQKFHHAAEVGGWGRLFVERDFPCGQAVRKT
jgi:hypothetical protein